MIEPIGKIVSPYKEKFGIPRQPQLVSAVKARVEIMTTVCAPESFEGLEKFNFIWLLCLFHQATNKSSKVRPPRLGGNKKMGVFATRSPYRPNPISLSLVKLCEIEHDTQGRRTVLHVEGIDLVNLTPVFDIKPYISNYDTPWEQANDGWLEQGKPQSLLVEWSDLALKQIQELSHKKTDLDLIENVLKWDPRPAYHASKQDNEERDYHCILDCFDIRFNVKSAQVIILEVKLTNR